jgi:hypothetical protein
MLTSIIRERSLQLARAIDGVLSDEHGHITPTEHIRRTRYALQAAGWLPDEVKHTVEDIQHLAYWTWIDRRASCLTR